MERPSLRLFEFASPRPPAAPPAAGATRPPASRRWSLAPGPNACPSAPPRPAPAPLAARCHHCQAAAFHDEGRTVRRSVAGHTFTADLTVRVCGACGEGPIDAESVGRFELLVARTLLAAGGRSGEALRWARKALGYRAADLAFLLDVAPEALSRWEAGYLAASIEVLAVLGALVDDELAGRTTTRDRLQALREPTPLAPAVTLRLI